MSHHIYNTKTFVIDSYQSKESDLMINLYTEDFGLICAVAQGVREMKSKLRYSLQELSFGTVALVRGRELWRITNASSEISLFNKGLNNATKIAIAGLLKFVKRFAPGEAKSTDIFETLKQVSSFLFRNQKMISKNEIEVSVLISKLRIMYILGYVKDTFDNKKLLTEEFDLEKVKNWQKDEVAVQIVIEEAIGISHL